MLFSFVQFASLSDNGNEVDVEALKKKIKNSQVRQLLIMVHLSHWFDGPSSHESAAV